VSYKIKGGKVVRAEVGTAITAEELERRRALLEKSRGRPGDDESWFTDETITAGTQILIELGLVREVEPGKFQASKDLQRMAEEEIEIRDEIQDRLIDLWATGELTPELRERILFGTEFQH
jgi:hypothetical protein